jgi:hypothetical protein
MIDLKWNPAKPVSSMRVQRLSTQNYKSDLSFDFEEGDFSIENGDLKTVNGLDGFIQRFIKVLLKEKSDIGSYGLQEYLPTSTDTQVFYNQCEELAKQIVKHEYSDSIPGNPNGIGYTVEDVYSIERVTKNGKSFLVFEITATGEPKKFNIELPIQFFKG